MGAAKHCKHYCFHSIYLKLNLAGSSEKCGEIAVKTAAAWDRVGQSQCWEWVRMAYLVCLLFDVSLIGNWLNSFICSNPVPLGHSTSYHILPHKDTTLVWGLCVHCQISLLFISFHLASFTAKHSEASTVNQAHWIFLIRRPTALIAIPHNLW